VSRDHQIWGDVSATADEEVSMSIAVGAAPGDDKTTELQSAARRSGTGTWRRFRSHRLAMAGIVILTLLTFSAVAAPLLAGHSPYRTSISQYRKGPNHDHLLGSDGSGRDVLARLLYAGRISLSVGLVAVSIYTAIGVVLGALAGYYGGKVDAVIMRLADIFLAFPALIIIITIVSVLGPSVWNIMWVIGLLGWPPIARILRGQFLSLREQEFVVASRAMGARNGRIIFRHMLPNALAPIIVAATFGMASAILLEAGLSFLGLGVQPPTASWGNMLSDAQSLTILQSMPWLWLPPGAMIALAVLSINFIGDGLRDAFDPHANH
jgi:peptide/nickel transport system permease protein